MLELQHMPVPSSEKGGGLDEGLAAHLRKKTHTLQKRKKILLQPTHPWERNGSISGGFMTQIGESRKEATLLTTIL